MRAASAARRSGYRVGWALAFQSLRDKSGSEVVPWPFLPYTPDEQPLHEVVNGAWAEATTPGLVECAGMYLAEASQWPPALRMCLACRRPVLDGHPEEVFDETAGFVHGPYRGR